jgi:RHS repeat-associated protein
MKTVDSSGVVVNECEDDVYGTLRSSSGSQDNEFRFAGQQTDGSTGLQYLRARYYDMETGRFLSREPLAVGPVWLGQPYGYGGASPALLVDPTGLFLKSTVKKVTSAASDVATAVSATVVQGASTVAGVVEDSGRWLAEDYRWAGAMATAGAVAAVAGGCILTVGGLCAAVMATAAGPYLAGSLVAVGTGMAVGGASIQAANYARDCKAGSNSSCAQAAVEAAQAVLNPFPGLLLEKVALAAASLLLAQADRFWLTL